MSKLYLSVVTLLFSFSSFAQVTFSALNISPQFPKPGRIFNFEYNSNKTKLVKQKNIKAVAYLFTGKTERGYTIVEPEVRNEKGILKGEIKVDSNAAVVAFVFTSVKEKDSNDSIGYLFPVYDNNNMPVETYYRWASNIQFPYGQILFGMGYNIKKGLSILDEAIVRFPASKTNQQFLGQYLYLLNSLPSEQNSNIIKKELEKYEAKENLNEEDLKMLIEWYGILKITEKADSFDVLMKKNYPNGDWFIEEMTNSFFAEQKADLKGSKFKLIEAKFPEKSGVPNSYNDFRTMVANAYAKEGNFKEFEIWNSSVPNKIKANSFNGLAQNFATTNRDLEFAKKIASYSANFAKNEFENPTEEKPDYITTEEWIKFRKNTYAEFSDTYVSVLQKLGEYDLAFDFAKDAATIAEFKNKGYNERYALSAAKKLSTKETRKLLEKFIVERSASKRLQELYKEIYLADNKNSIGYDAYFSKLKKESYKQRLVELQKEILNESAPNFSLKDFNGKLVSLSSMKGNTVVVDFWATWCGPCIASMPAMNKALAKFKTNKTVKFLFVDSWERSENKRQNALDFMTKNKYHLRC